MLVNNLWSVILGVVIAAALSGYWIGRKHEANAQTAALLKETQRAQIAEARLRQKGLEIDVHDNAERAALDQRLIVNLSRPEPISLCERAVASQSAVASAPGGRDATGDGRPVLQAGPDLGPALHVYGRDCERLRQKLTTLQAWAAMVVASQRSESSR